MVIFTIRSSLGDLKMPKTIKIIYITIICLTAISCMDQQRTSRARSFQGFENDSDSSYSSPSNNYETTKSYPTTGSNQSTTNIPSDANHCTFSMDGSTGYTKFSSDLLDYNVCQSSQNESKIYFQQKVPYSGSRICFIPTYNETGSSLSIYLGSPGCVFVNNKSTIYEIQLEKNRSAPYGAPPYSNFPIKGLIIVKDEAKTYPAPYSGTFQNPDAFLLCSQKMDIGDARFCETFKSLGFYTFVKFSN